MLRHGSYPEIWGRGGYPDSPFQATLRGNVLHGALETVVKAIAAHDCDGHPGPCNVTVLKALGGYSAVLQSVLETVLAALEGNPRIAPRLGSIRRALTLELPELRRGLQATIARSEIVARGPGRMPSGEHRPLGVGSHAEVELRVPSMGWIGKADRITIDSDICRITDYKTGAPQESHEEQLRIYALLWARDGAVNPSRRIATELVASYPAHEELFPAPSRDELDLLEADLRARSAAALASIAARPPLARPETAYCSHCPVRQLCDSYWEHLRNSPLSGSGSPADRPTDVELTVSGRNGPRSWLGVVRSGFGLPPESGVVLRSHHDGDAYRVGATMRVLNVSVERDETEGFVFVTTSDYSEVFPLRAPSG